MTILCVRFQLPPIYEAALPQLIGMLEGFTPVVEALPPDRALVDLRGAERYFGRDAVELAALIRVRALAWYGIDCAIGARARADVRTHGPARHRARRDPRGARGARRRRRHPGRTARRGACGGAS